MKAKRFIGNRKYSSKDEEMVLSDEAQAEIDEVKAENTRLKDTIAAAVWWLDNYDGAPLAILTTLLDAALEDTDE